MSYTTNQSVHVALAERAYEIVIGTGNLPELGSFLGLLGRCSHAVVITDECVETPHAEQAVEALATSGVQVDLLVIEAGESSKSIEVANQLWEKLLELGADRKSVVIAVGGGVIGDLAGFVAATFARGLSFVQVPTTLLAQVDSSVGGKVGINLPQAKNMVGAFWQPRGVWIDTAVLDTLPEREYRAGLAEVVKYGVILDAEFFQFLEAQVPAIQQRQADVLRHIVARCCRLKADVVEQDEREETGLRAVLNYGHTFCHAFETLCGYGQLLHGEGVSIGMMCAARLAQRLGRVDLSFVHRQRELLAALHLPLAVPSLDPNAVLDVMSRDKKVEHGRLRFVLPTRMGHVELVGDIAPVDVRAALSDEGSAP